MLLYTLLDAASHGVHIDISKCSLCAIVVEIIAFMYYVAAVTELMT
jgi:hypothetical protein